jgi:hypothetical protein
MTRFPTPVLLCALLCALPAVAHSEPLNIIETTGFPNSGALTYFVMGTLGSGLNTVSGSVDGTFVGPGDFTDLFELIVPVGFVIRSPQVEVTNFTFGYGSAPFTNGQISYSPEIAYPDLPDGYAYFTSNGTCILDNLRLEPGYIAFAISTPSSINPTTFYSFPHSFPGGFNYSLQIQVSRSPSPRPAGFY